MYKKFILRETDQGVIQGIHWEKADPKFVICIIHGIGEHAVRYNRVAMSLMNEDMAVLSMDLRGHGESLGKRGHAAPRTQVHQDIDQLIALANKTYPKARLVLYGHSMGGNIVLDYKKRGDMNDLPAAYIISAPWVELVRSTPKPLYALVKLLSKLTPSMLITSKVSEKDLGHPESVGHYSTDPLVHDKISVLCAAEGFDIGTALANGVLSDNGKAKDKPMLLMHGDQDKVCSVKGSRKIAELDHCRYIEWPGLYHEIHNGGGDSKGTEVIDAMTHWILELPE